jgi:peptide/nickel transport system permease protein
LSCDGGIILQGKYALTRVTHTVITLFIVLIIMWVLFRSIPGDPAAIFISGRLSPEDIEALRHQWGLDAPLFTQFLNYLKNLLTGSFGISFYYREPVMGIIAPRFANTLILMGPAMIMAIVCGAMLGSHLGWKRGSKRERLGAILSLFARSFPIYLSGIIALMIFTHLLGWFPLGGMRTIGRFYSSWLDNFLDVTHHLALPLMVAFLYYIGDVVVIARTSMLELIGEEFLQFSKAKGLPDSRVRKIAMVMIGFAFGGEVLLETDFSWPGIGRLMVNSVTRHDYPVAQASFFIMAVVVIVMNLVVDLLYVYLDPRIAYEKSR